MQTKLGNYLTNSVNEDFNTNISVEKVDLSFLGRVSLKGVEIRDHHQDTLIFAKKLSTSLLNAKRILDNEVNLKSISLEGVDFFMKTYKDEDEDNLAVFINSFDDDTPKDSLSNPFILKTDNVYIQDLHFKLIDANKKDSLDYEVSKLGGNLQDLSIVGPDFKTNIRGLYFTDINGLEVSNLTTDFEYKKTAMHFKETTLETKYSTLKADIDFTYKREDLADFNNKVNIKAKFDNSKIAIKDLKKFYDELNGNDIIYFKGNVDGVLNKFDLSRLNLSTKNGIKLVANLFIENLINTERGFVFEGDIKNLTATHKELKKILPNILGKTLPSEFNKLGKFTLIGIVKVTPNQIIADVELDSEIGTVVSDLSLINIDDIDYADYEGSIGFDKFDIGEFFNYPLFGLLSLRGDVNGEGFKLENIKTSFIGKISRIDFQGYSYKNISANGQYQNNKFDGDLTIDDDNFKMKFNGLADLSSEISEFDFESNIAYLNLKETNLFSEFQA